MQLDQLGLKIGYPKYILNADHMHAKYASMNVTGASFFDNMAAKLVWDSLDNRRKLLAAVDKSEWSMSPSSVNAYYVRPEKWLRCSS